MSHLEEGAVQAEHMRAMHKQFCEREKKPPAVLAIGRWDARRLAHYAAVNAHDAQGRPIGPRQLLSMCSVGCQVMGATVRVDSRLGTCPGALWWQP